MRAAAERARDEITANGVARPALRACRAEGDDGTRLARCCRLNPLEPLALDAVKRFAGKQRPAQWRRAAQGMEILLPEV